MIDRWHVGFASDVFAGRHPEDGSRVGSFCFCVLIEEKRGRY